MKEKTPLIDNLWKTDQNGISRLVGERCSNCDEVYFPKTRNNYCPCCQEENTMFEVLLGNEGYIHSYTVVHQFPAGGFYNGNVPYAYGIVELPIEVRLKTLFSGDLGKLAGGEKVKLQLVVIYEDDEFEYLTYSFEPTINQTVGGIDN